MIEPGGVTVGEVPARGQRRGAGLLPADTQPAGAGLHAHAVGDHALEDPSGHPRCHGLPVIGDLGDRGPKDGDRAVVVAADQPGDPQVKEAGVSGDGKVREPAFHMVRDSAVLFATRAADIDGHRVAVQVGDVAGVGGIVDA